MKTLFLFVGLMFGLMPNSNSAIGSTTHSCDVEYIQQTETTVYVTRTGKKFHKSTCFHISNRQTSSMSRSNAVKHGYEACKHCKP